MGAPQSHSEPYRTDVWLLKHVKENIALSLTAHDPRAIYILALDLVTMLKPCAWLYMGLYE